MWTFSTCPACGRLIRVNDLGDGPRFVAHYDAEGWCALECVGSWTKAPQTAPDSPEPALEKQCCCPSSDARMCYLIRYGDAEPRDGEMGEPEKCECRCHGELAEDDADATPEKNAPGL